MFSELIWLRSCFTEHPWEILSYPVKSIVYYWLQSIVSIHLTFSICYLLSWEGGTIIVPRFPMRNKWLALGYTAMPPTTSLHCPTSQCLWCVETSEPATFWAEGHMTEVHHSHRKSICERIVTSLLTRSDWVLCNSVGHGLKALRRRLVCMMVGGRDEQAKHQCFYLVVWPRGVLPSWNPHLWGWFSLLSGVLIPPFLVLSLLFNAPALCPSYPNTCYQIEGGL